MIDLVLRRLAAEPGLDVSRAVVAGVDKHPSSKVTYLGFDAHGRLSAVAKVARDRSREFRLEHEHESLTRLWDARIPSVVNAAPEPLFLERIEGRLVLAERGLAGTPMSTSYYARKHTAKPSRVADDFGRAYAWLRRFHRESRTGSAPLDAALFDRFLVPLIARFRAEVGAVTPDEDAVFEEVAARAEALRGMVVPLTAVHGDLWMGNLLVRPGSVTGVIDWEQSAAVGLPFGDIYKFPTSYGFYLDRPYGGRAVPGHPDRSAAVRAWQRYGAWQNLGGFAYTFFGTGWFPELVRRAIGEHFTALGIAEDLHAIFFPMFLVAQALETPDPSFREGYRALLRGWWFEREKSWMWDSSSSAGFARTAEAR